MSTTELNRLVILLLLSKNGGKDSSYAIIRLITRRFGMWDFIAAINDAVKEGLITRAKDAGIDIYLVTGKGEDALSRQITSLQEMILAEFPSQKEFMDVLFS